MTNASLRHNWNRNRGLDLLDHVRIRHAGDSALCADIGRYTLKSHYGDRTSILSDLRLLNVDDIHDDAAFEHLSHTSLDATCASYLLGVLRHSISLCQQNLGCALGGRAQVYFEAVGAGVLETG